MISLLSLVALVCLLIAQVPALMVRDNLRVFRTPKVLSGRDTPQAVSVLIPARDEGNTIEASVSAALAGEGVEVEVLVLDDRSQDATAEIVQAMARSDRRVR